MTSTHTRRYLAALVDGGGTVPPELGAIRRLVERGHEVTVLADDSMEPEVRATGAACCPWVRAPNRPDRLPEHDPLRDWEVKNPLQLFDRLIEKALVGPAGAYAADLRDAISDGQPEVVLCSQFALGGMVGAEAAGLPFVVLMPNVYILPAAGMPPFGLGLKPAGGVFGWLRDRVVGGFNARLWDRKGLPRLNALRSEFGLQPLKHFWEQVHRADRELVMTSPAFDFPATLPDRARYVGRSSTIPFGRVRGLRCRVTRRSYWSRCPRHSRISRPACSASLTPLAPSPCAGSSPRDPHSIPRRCLRPPTSRSSPQHRTRPSCVTRRRSSPTAGMAR